MIANKTLARMGLGPVWRLRGADAAEATPEVMQNVRSEVAEVANTEPKRVEAPRIEFDVQPAPLQVPPMPPDEGVQAPAWSWDELAETVRDCRKCRLCERRKQAVLGVGDREADWMFVGEGPGAEEDERGEPFVGQAGRLLDAMLAALGLKRGNNVYIANTVKCRPPNNRTPEAEEMAACFPYLLRQIALVQPKLIVALGRPAAQALLDQEVRIGAARGRLFRFGELPVVVTYHPAYLLRNPADKSKAWEDLCFARRTIRQQS
ncbi:MAG: uracil-DNA glycosylase [Betaproteobacteria bacterium]|nr:uracil-DNA glycosylase [Betaproteobacteria bacterium]